MANITTANATAACSQMASVVYEYCNLIDQCNDISSGQCRGQYWLRHMEKLLPRIHSTVVSLKAPTPERFIYNLPDDDLRCELFMRLNEVLLKDNILWSGLDRAQIKHNLCESLADDFTDIYFDLKQGLELYHEYPLRPAYAIHNWQASYYSHWGQHLVDAETWLHAVEARNFSSITATLETIKTTA